MYICTYVYKFALLLLHSSSFTHWRVRVYPVVRAHEGEVRRVELVDFRKLVHGRLLIVRDQRHNGEDPQNQKNKAARTFETSFKIPITAGCLESVSASDMFGAVVCRLLGGRTRDARAFIIMHVLDARGATALRGAKTPRKAHIMRR